MSGTSKSIQFPKVAGKPHRRKRKTTDFQSFAGPGTWQNTGDGATRQPYGCRENARPTVTEQNRQFFRLTYPRTGCPELVVNGRAFAIVEISENGVRVKLPQTVIEAWPIEGTVGGQVRFSDGETFKVVGVIVRHETIDDEVQCVVSLSEGIPYARMVAEQRFRMQIFSTSPRPE